MGILDDYGKKVIEKNGKRTEPKKESKPLFAGLFKKAEPKEEKIKRGRPTREEVKKKEAQEKKEYDEMPKLPQEPVRSMNGFAGFVANMMGYKHRVVIIKKIGGRLEYHHDVAKRVRMPHGTYKLKLWVENQNLPYPPPETWIDGTIWIYSPRRAEYTYLSLDLEKGIIKAIDSDMVFWVENEIIEAMNKYTNPNKWANLMSYIGIGVFMIMVVIALIIFVQKAYFPMMELAQNGISVNCSCPITTTLPIPVSNVPTV